MSGAHHEPTEPRIVKKKKSHQAAHGGAWKVAYADFVTAMMALFIVLWIMSQSQTIRLNVAQYFKNPGVLPGSTGLLETSDISGGMPIPGHSQELQTPSPIKPDVSKVFSDQGSLEEVKRRITEVIAQLPELSRLKDQVALEITDEGLRIELLDQETSHFFDIGSANLKPETQELLKLIAQELGKIPNRITIEGHTDSRPYGGKNYTNWELSADRANSARRIMGEAGVKKGQITSVRGCADQQLRNQQDPMDVQNRRVSIIVKSQDGTKVEPIHIPKLHSLPISPAPEDASPSQSLPTSPSTQPAPLQGPGQDVSSQPHSHNTGPRESSDRQPGKAGIISNPVVTGDALPTSHRLEDQVREEVQQLFDQENSLSTSSGNSLGFEKKPRQRLGW